MARKAVGSDNENVTVLDPSGAVDEVKLPPVGEGGAVRGDATLRNKAVDESAVKPVRHFVVTRGATILAEGGYRTTLKEGKEIDDRNYDIRRLQQQGVRLRELKDEDRNAPIDDSSFIS